MAEVIATAEEDDFENAAVLLQSLLYSVAKFRYLKVATSRYRVFKAAPRGLDALYDQVTTGTVEVLLSKKGDLYAKVDTIDSRGGTIVAKRNLHLDKITADLV